MDPNRQLMAARVRTGANFSLGSAEVLFDARDYGAGGSVGRSYDISPDGKRFLMVKEGGDETSATEFILVQNWFEELKRLVPTNNYTTSSPGWIWLARHFSQSRSNEQSHRWGRSDQARNHRWTRRGCLLTPNTCAQTYSKSSTNSFRTELARSQVRLYKT